MFIVLKNGGILGYYKVIQLYELHSIKPNGRCDGAPCFENLSLLGRGGGRGGLSSIFS